MTKNQKVESTPKASKVILGSDYNKGFKRLFSFSFIHL